MYFLFFFFFFNDTATTEIYTLSLHDALPISLRRRLGREGHVRSRRAVGRADLQVRLVGGVVRPQGGEGAVRGGCDRRDRPVGLARGCDGIDVVDRGVRGSVRSEAAR